MAGNLTRRDLLKAGAIITAMAGCSGEETRSQTPPADQPVPPVTGNLTADVVVVGAGFAGLGAAWELFKKGQRVIVLEANSRIGGRIWSSQLSDGSLFEIGGQWVSDAQTDIRTLINELGVGDRIYPTSDAGLTVFVGSNGKLSRFNQHASDPLEALPPLDPAAQLEVATTFAALQIMSSVVNVNAPWEDRPFPEIPGLLGPQSTAEADQWTVEAWMELNMETDDAKALIRASLSGHTGVDTGALSLLHELFVLQTFGGSFLNLAGSGPGQAEQFRVTPPGASQIADLIVQRLGPSAVRVNEPVKLIRQDDRGVTVTTTTGLIAEAKRVIVTAPGALDTFIRFDPILPPDRAQLQQRVPQGSVWKIWLVYDRAFWREQGLSGDTISILPGDFIPNSRDGGPPAAQLSPGLMICFVVANQARAFNAMTRQARRAQVLKEMVYRYGAQAAQLSPTIHFPAVPPQNPAPDDYFEFNWSIEEFARGDFAAAPGPGVYTGVGFGPAIRAPFGRIHWAGVDTSSGPNYSSFSSAVQSGKRAVAEVLAAG